LAEEEKVKLSKEKGRGTEKSPSIGDRVDSAF